MAMQMGMDMPSGVEVRGAVAAGEYAASYGRILSYRALEFVAWLHRQFDGRRQKLLEERQRCQQAIDLGQMPQMPAETRPVREGSWQVRNCPPDLQRRHVEITGPVDRKMIINAMNSGANVFMADFEDANSPTWSNSVEGQIHLWDAVRRTIRHVNAGTGRSYELLPEEQTAVLMVRPRGWHLPERHIFIDGQPLGASLMDFGLFHFHNAEELVQRGSGPYLYLPKLQNHQEAGLWAEIFQASEDYLGLERGTVRCTVLVEHILAGLEMDEIIHALREHIVGMNAGRWDYLFSIIKTFRQRPDMVLPDRAQLSMTVPFMRAYTERLVHTCHRRGIHAIGGMAAQIPSRDAAQNAQAMARVRADKERESRDGFDGSWVAHPGLVPLVQEVFEQVLGSAAHQKDRLREDVAVSAGQLLDFAVPGGTITEEGVRTNIRVGVEYLASWLSGVGAAALHNLMEDAATAEISRSQIWQWLHHDHTLLADGRRLDVARFEDLFEQEMRTLEQGDGARGLVATPAWPVARELFHRIVTQAHFEEFLTLAAYPHLDGAPLVGPRRS